MKQDAIIPAEKHQLIEESLPLVRWTVRKYFKCDESIVGLAFDDLYQEGCIALCRAAAAYKTQRGEFDTFAVTVIRNHLIDYCRAIASDVRGQPVTSLDEMAESGWEGDSRERLMERMRQSTEDAVSSLNAGRFLKSRRLRYQGVARLGVEALELKIMEGYGVTDIAKRYGAKPNLVGAWMSRATQKIRADITEEELNGLGVEKVS